MTMPTQLQGRLRLPVISAPMFLGSGPDLVIGACRAGVLGTFPALNLRTTEDFDGWLTRIEQALAQPDDSGREPAPYGVNFIVHRTNKRIEADLEKIVEHEVPVVITSLGAAKEVVDAVHSYGGLVFHDVTNAKFATKAAQAGVDGLILVTAGAGGHAGGINPFALITEVRRVWDGPLILGGSLSTGRDVLAAQAAGADLAYMGTRFLATHESIAPEEYRQMIVRSGAEEIVYTPSISTIPANFLRQSIVDAGLDPDNLPAPDKVDVSHVTNPHAEEEPRSTTSSVTPKAWKDVWSAGHSVAGITEVLPVAELVDQLEAEYLTAKGDLLAVLDG
ncbi:NAD(P)H-dependent flavin oxidoreductase [Janibacter cremeus]|uniref:Nitronate monooxygenase n=1 Tax=Janibacter cremeus TaxID=1285192 RepID=A0A852VY75_9MICO|nr:nitronate monooxygenase [Janibacter cremeus]NYF98461.1 nitronate monooxygenase [Janibacter cremeus]